MRLETFPIIVGILAALIGLGLVFDAWTPDDIIVRRERRRRPRIERSRGGETAIGLGVLCMAAAFLGRDTWRYSVVAVIAGTVLLLLGAIGNRRYLGQAISHRGVLRRRPTD
jgi:Na+/H+ antiporter NhaD/arsenite permease-like protein